MGIDSAMFFILSKARRKKLSRVFKVHEFLSGFQVS